MTTGSALAIAGYAARAEGLVARYQRVPNDIYCAPVRHLIPETPCRVIDIGSGTGRDAVRFADLGHRVTAVEPVAAFLAVGRADTRIDWRQDALPDLASVSGAFELITIAGVWQHLDAQERLAAAPVVSRLAAVGALLLLSLRHGPAPEGRPVHAIDVDETVALFGGHGFSVVLRQATGSIQPENRAAGVTWTWLALRKNGDAA